MAVKISECLSGAKHPGIQSSFALVLKLWYQKVRMPLLRRGSLERTWKRVSVELWVSLAPPPLPIIAFPTTTSSSHACLTRPAISQRKQQPLDNSLNFLLPDPQAPTPTFLMSVEQVCVILTAGGHSFHLRLLTAPVCCMSSLAPSLLCVDMLNLLASGCQHLLFFLPEISFSPPDPFSWSFPGWRLFLNLQPKLGSLIVLSQSTYSFPQCHASHWLASLL